MKLHRVTRGVTVVARAEDDSGERWVDVIASTEDVDGYDEIVVQDWDFSAFEKVPSILFAHDLCSLPVGFGSDWKVADGKLSLRLNFVTAEANPLAEQCFQSFKQGSLRAVSVGFVSSKIDEVEIDGRTVRRFSGNKLLEVSAAPVPVNSGAVATAVAKAVAPPMQRRAATQEVKKMDEKEFLTQLLADIDAAIAAGDTSDGLAASRASVSDRLDELGAPASEEAKAEGDADPDADKKDEAKAKSRGITERERRLAMQVKALEKKDEDRDREDLIRRGRDSGQLVPAQVPWARKQSIASLKGYLESTPRNARLSTARTEPGVIDSGAGLTFQGKSWEQLSTGDKHNLHMADKPLYDAMKNAAGR